jgi:hypothetical protein
MYHSIGPSLRCSLVPRCASACLSIYGDTMPYGGYFKCTFFSVFGKTIGHVNEHYCGQHYCSVNQLITCYNQET